MKVTIFSSNQPRHLNLAKQLSLISNKVFFISEVNTIFPGQVDDFFKKSATMQKYFKKVIDAERKIFGDISFLPSNVSCLPIKSGDLNKMVNSQLKDALNSDLYIVFGASYIKGWLIDFLVEKKAINIHMGISPYYRGSSCNFWALYDNNPGYVGATIHLLSKGLDNGDILFHCVPDLLSSDNTFDFSMRSVMEAHKALVNLIENKKLFSMNSFKQDRSKEIRYTKNIDFNDEVADLFLRRDMQLKSNEFVYPFLLNNEFRD